jgi:hypothetical protein
MPGLENVSDNAQANRMASAADLRSSLRPGYSLTRGQGATNGTHPRVKSRADINRKESTKKETHIRKIQNDNITFRVTTDLKKRLTEFCLENDLHNSAVLHQRDTSRSI